MQGWRDAEQEGCSAEVMHDRWNAGLEGFRKEEYRAGGMQDRRYEGQQG